MIQVGEPLPIDAGPPRLWRSGLLARHLAERGHDVQWWASTFEHRTKSHRRLSDERVPLAERLGLFLLHSPGYRHNVSLGRLRDHRFLGRRFRALAPQQDRPDVIHCGFPTIELSLEAARYGARHGIPVVLDVRDLWPDIFVVDPVVAPLRWLARLVMRAEYERTREAFRLATAVSGHAPGFVEFGLHCAGRRAGPFDRAFPFGYPVDHPTGREIEEARAFWTRCGIREDDETPTICFLGTFGVRRALDLITPIRAARVLHDRGVRARFVLCGSGPRLEDCRREAAGLPNVVLPGWVGYPETWTLMRLSRIGLLPYLPHKDFALSMPNKSVEYLSGSLPVLTSLTGGHLEQVLRASGCGVFYPGGDPIGLADSVCDLFNQPMLLKAMGEKAGRLFAEHYAADKVCDGMAEHLEAVVQTRVPTSSRVA